MDSNIVSFNILCSVLPLQSVLSKTCCRSLTARSSTRVHGKRLPKKLRYPRRSKLPPDFGVNLFLKNPSTSTAPSPSESFEKHNADITKGEEENGNCSDIVWEPEEVEAISSLFQGRIPQKPGNLNRERPLPLPVPYKIRPLRLPASKHRVKKTSPALVNQIYKNPSSLISLAKQIKRLDQDQDASLVLDDYSRFLRKGSLSLTIKELGHMGVPDRALQTFYWAQKQRHLFPDNRILASTVEVLARNDMLKVPINFTQFVSLTSCGVIEAMLKGFIRAGSLELAWRLVSVARDCNRVLASSVYAKLILKLGTSPYKLDLAASLLDDLAEREDLDLNPQDFTAIMKVCIRLGRFDVVENLYNWFKQSEQESTIVMYTTMIHSRYTEGKYREALALVWEMEGSNCLFDLPAYRVVMKLFVALNDLSRAATYFSRLKEAGFSPTYDIYKNLITLYMESGRLAKCREIWKEAEMAGFEFDKQTTARMLQLQGETRKDF